MKKILFVLLLLPAIHLATPQSVSAQNGVNALLNVIETLQFLKDIKENKSKVEAIAVKVKAKYSDNDPIHLELRDKFNVVKLSADNILNSLIIDLMDKDKRRLFIDRPNLMNDYYGESVQLYNQSVKNFNEAYLKTTEGKDAGIGSLLKNLLTALVGELINVTKRLAIEILVEKLKAPYTMKSWKEIQ